MEKNRKIITIAICAIVVVVAVVAVIAMNGMSNSTQSQSQQAVTLTQNQPNITNQTSTFWKPIGDDPTTTCIAHHAVKDTNYVC